MYNNPLKRNFIEDLINHGLLSYFTQDSAFKDNTKWLREKPMDADSVVIKNKHTSEE